MRSRTDLSFQAWLIHSFNIHVLSSYSVPGSARCNKGIRHSSCSLEIYILVIRQKEKKKSLCPLQRQENKNPTFRDISHLWKADTSVRSLYASVLPISHQIIITALPKFRFPIPSMRSQLLSQYTMPQTRFVFSSRIGFLSTPSLYPIPHKIIPL